MTIVTIFRSPLIVIIFSASVLVSERHAKSYLTMRAKVAGYGLASSVGVLIYPLRSFALLIYIFRT